MPTREVVPERLSRDKRRITPLLKKLGYKGLEINAIDVDRIYCLTQPVYHGENAERVWARAALTVVLRLPPEVPDIEHKCFIGWVVPSSARLQELRDS